MSVQKRTDAAFLRARARRLTRRADKLDGAAAAAPRRPAAASAAKTPPAGTQPPPPPARPGWKGHTAEQVDAALLRLPPTLRGKVVQALAVDRLVGRHAPTGMGLSGTLEHTLLSALAAGRDRPAAPAPEEAALRKRQDDRLMQAGLVNGTIVTAGG